MVVFRDRTALRGQSSIRRSIPMSDYTSAHNKYLNVALSQMQKLTVQRDSVT